MTLCPDCKGLTRTESDLHGPGASGWTWRVCSNKCGWTEFKSKPLIQEKPMVKPIKPSEIQDLKNAQIPEWVIECVNKIIVDKWNGRQAQFTLKEIMSMVMVAAPEGTTRNQIYDNHWMNFEDLYRREGWEVEFNKAGYNETFDDFFVFSKK